MLKCQMSLGRQEFAIGGKNVFNKYFSSDHVQVIVGQQRRKYHFLLLSYSVTKSTFHT